MAKNDLFLYAPQLCRYNGLKPRSEIWCCNLVKRCATYFRTRQVIIFGPHPYPPLARGGRYMPKFLTITGWVGSEEPEVLLR